MKIDLRQVVRVVSMAGSVLLAPPAVAGANGASPPASSAASLFVITLRPGPSWPAAGWKPGDAKRNRGMRDHYFYWKALDERGMVAVAGPVGADAGLIVLRAASKSEVDQVIKDDPAIKTGLFIGEARPFVPRFVGKAPMVPVKP